MPSIQDPAALHHPQWRRKPAEKGQCGKAYQLTRCSPKGEGDNSTVIQDLMKIMYFGAGLMSKEKLSRPGVSPYKCNRTRSPAGTATRFSL